MTWDFGDGNNATTTTNRVSHIYASPGTYRVTFNASTSGGAIDAGNFTVVVDPPCGPNDLMVGQVYEDANANGIRDGLESIRPGDLLQDNAGNVISSDVNGEYGYYFLSGPGFVDLLPVLNHNYVNPATGRHNIISMGTNQLIGGRDFGVVSVPFIRDLRISIAAALPVPGIVRTYHLTYQNVGTVVMNGNVQFDFDPSLVYVGSSAGGAFIGPNRVQWNFVNLAPGETRHVYAFIQIPPSIGIGTVLNHAARVNPIVGDATPGNNTLNLQETVVAGFDPNDKTVFPAGDGPDGNVPPGTELSYLIRFQNTGTYYAQDITVKDMLDSDLDQTTLEIIGSSHPMSWTLSQSELVFSFPGIMLPDSNMNEPLSHGWIRYSISPKANVPLGTRIENSAAIYFDFNPAVITNTTVNTISLSVATEPSQAGQALSIVPHPVGQMATVRFDNPNGLSHSFSLLDLSGKEVSRIEGIGGESFALDRKGLPAGIYLYRLTDTQGQQVSVGRLVIQ